MNYEDFGDTLRARLDADIKTHGTHKEPTATPFKVPKEPQEHKQGECPPGTKYDSGKSRYDLIPPEALEEVAKVLTFGATKYAPENWRKVPDAMNRYFASSQRHIWQFKRGEKYDNEQGGSNCHHLACAITGLMFMLELELLAEKHTQEQKGIK
jgi:Domain of unknown function (DUF5664)